MATPNPQRIRLGSRLIWTLVHAAVWLFYRVERVGTEPPAGPLLLVANHPNALLDPGLIMSTTARRVFFLAKSTLFKMPVIGPLARALNAIPVYRRIDKSEEVSRNSEMFAAVSQALAEGEAVCLFPEGISHSSGQLAPLRTGAARIVLAAAGQGHRVAIVPVGLNFNRKAMFRSTVIVAYGQAFYWDTALPGSRSEKQEAVRTLTELIACRLRDVIVEVEPTEDAKLVSQVERLYSAARQLAEAPADRFERRRRIAAGLGALRSRDPDRFALIYGQLTRYRQRLRRYGLSEQGLGRAVSRRAALYFLGRELLLATVLMPVAVAGAIVFAVPYFAIDLILRSRQVHHEEQATWKVAGGALLYLVWIGALSIAAGAAGGEWALITLLGLPLLGVAALFAGEREAEVLDLVKGYLASRLTPASARNHLLSQRAELADLLEETYAALSRPLDNPESGRPDCEPAASP